MFVLDQSDSYLWPVSIDLPADRSKKTFTFDAEFRRIDQERTEELIDQYNRMVMQLRRRVTLLEGYGGDDAAALEEPLEITNEEIVDEVLCGWQKVVDAKGKDVPFNEATKAQMFKVQGAATAIVRAWMNSIGSPGENSAAKAGGFRAKN